MDVVMLRDPPLPLWAHHPTAFRPDDCSSGFKSLPLDPMKLPKICFRDAPILKNTLEINQFSQHPLLLPAPQKMAGGGTHWDHCSRMSPLFLSLPSLPHPPRWPQLKVETHNRAPSYFLAQHNTARTFAEGSPTSEQVGLGVKSCSIV